MKKFLSVVSAMLLLANFSARAQNAAFHFGILGGLTNDWIGSTSANKNTSLAGWHGGFAVEVKLPMYFGLQPGVQYELGHSNVLVSSFGAVPEYNELKIHRISVPLALQWGPDLGVIRIFGQFVPTFNFNVGGEYKDATLSNGWYPAMPYINPFQFGLGLGLGIELWKIQLSARYNWLFGDWRLHRDDSPFKNNSSGTEGVTFSVGFFF